MVPGCGSADGARRARAISALDLSLYPDLQLPLAHVSGWQTVNMLSLRANARPERCYCQALSSLAVDGVGLAFFARVARRSVGPKERAAPARAPRRTPAEHRHVARGGASRSSRTVKGMASRAGRRRSRAGARRPRGLVHGSGIAPVRDRQRSSQAEWVSRSTRVAPAAPRESASIASAPVPQ